MTSQRPRIYLIEDEAAVALLLAEYVRSFGCEICGTAATGELAVADIVRLTPDIVMSDIKLAGDMDGLQVMRELRNVVDAPVIFVTAYATESVRAAAYTVGCAAFLVKPVDPRRLHEAINAALGVSLGRTSVAPAPAERTSASFI